MSLPDREHDHALQYGPLCTYHGPARDPADIKWAVIHDAEGASAQGVAAYGASGNAQASWHVTVDDKIGIRCLADDVVAWHAYSPANQIGLGIELCGFASWNKLQWFIHQSTLKRAAWVVARWCLKYGIPPTFLSDAELVAHKVGLTTHAQITRVLKVGTHTDPGPNFPKGYFQLLVRRRYGWLGGKAV